jgi:glyoxylate/hydroxypyruvate reductase
VLVNTARGTLVDSDALAQALREEWIWGAGLDVVEGEPQVGAGHPLVKEPRSVLILSMLSSFIGKGGEKDAQSSVTCADGVIVPHNGSATFETRLGMVNLAARNALTGMDDEAMPAELDVAARILRWMRIA